MEIDDAAVAAFVPPQRPAAQSTGGGFGPRPHLPASSKGFGTMEKSARAMRRRGRVLHVASFIMASLLRCMEVANEPMPACAAGGRWAFRTRRASICNAFRLLAGLWGLCLGRRPSSQCRAPAFTQQDTPRRIADDKWRRTRINFHSAALLSPKPPWVPFSPALAFLPSPQWLDSSGRAAGATESSARGTIRNAVSSRVNVGCVGEAA